MIDKVMFGHIHLSPRQIFLMRENVFATVNLQPYAPGHVLVCPRRVVQKLQDLTEQ